ncbi:MAG: hypothetical protein WDN69_17620 [Aliidongia sp.]
MQSRSERFLGVTPRRAVYLLETGQIPAGKEGRTWIASRQALRDHYRRLTGARGRVRSAPSTLFPGRATA